MVVETRYRLKCPRPFCGGDILDLKDGDGLKCLLCSHKLNENITTKRQRAGQLGGIITSLKYDMRELGKRGGRPRSKAVAELRQQSALNEKEEATNGLPNNLRKLKELYKNRGEPAANGSPQGGR